jgi:dihydrofolate synthase/folylpolyglutamate synthase
LDAVRAIEPDPQRRPRLLAAVLADKDVVGIVELLVNEFPQVVVTQTSSPRALPAAELGGLFRQAGASDVVVAPDVASALELLADTPYVACGSITLAGEVAGIVRG